MIDMDRTFGYVGRMSGKGGRPTTVTQEHCDEALMAYLQFSQETGLRPSSTNYVSWQGRHSQHPTLNQIIRFGSWNNSLQRISSAMVVHHKSWSKAECLNAVRDFSVFCKQMGFSPTIKRYDVWRVKREAPTSSTVWRVLGAWPVAKEKIKPQLVPHW